MTMTQRWRFGDAVILLAVALSLAWFLHEVRTELDYQWDWARIGGYLLHRDDGGEWRTGLLLDGLLVTVRLTVWSGILAAAMGLLIGLARVAPSQFLRAPAAAYVGLIRNMPPLVFMFVFYFFISSQVLSPLNVAAWSESFEGGGEGVFILLFGAPLLFENFISGVVCLALFEAAYVAEIARGGLQSVPTGQREAGRSLGLSGFLILRFIVLPQALKKIAPPLAGQFISLVKDSSIISVISIQELTFSGAEVAVSSGRIFETWIAVALMYFSVCFFLSLAFRRLEKKKTDYS